MPKFRSKPTVIEAEQFRHPATSPLGVRTEEDGRAYVVNDHAQKVYLEPGDWIVPEPNGNGFHPIKPQIFAAKYVPIGAEIYESRQGRFEAPTT